MRVIVSGGSGLIGRALVEELVAGGYEAVVLSRSPEKVGNLPEGARAVAWDGESATGWGDLADGAAAVVNLAGASVADGRWTARRKVVLRSSRVDSTQAVTAAIRQAENRPRVLLQASAVGFYGADSGSEVRLENDPPGDDFLARLAVEWEEASREVEELGVRRVLLRTGVVLARNEGALPKLALPFKLGVGGPVGSGEQYFPWIHLADEIGAIRFLLEHETARGAFNLVAPNPVSNRELAKVLGRVLHRPSFVPTPALALRLALGEQAEMILGGQRAMPRGLEELGYEFQFPQVEGALEDLLT
jgi:uncharacterized protein (TIGR01777 family)